MGTVRALATQSGGVLLADAVAAFLATVAVPNIRRGYAAACNQLVSEIRRRQHRRRPGPGPTRGLVHLRVGQSGG
ncbi:MAG: hypothetical protein ACRDSH_25870 [Pseudonocardiaceae bacterium]